MVNTGGECPPAAADKTPCCACSPHLEHAPVKLHNAADTPHANTIMAEPSDNPATQSADPDNFYEIAYAARLEREYQAFVRDWCKDPWNAEQAEKIGEGWLRSCFSSAALAYAGGRAEAIAEEVERLRENAKSARS